MLFRLNVSCITVIMIIVKSCTHHIGEILLAQWSRTKISITKWTY